MNDLQIYRGEIHILQVSEYIKFNLLHFHSQEKLQKYFNIHKPTDMNI